ncbi:MAG: Asp-tRNA(Asn)/Glu-tRNA(Gln) amidotransferase subunit GatC [Candidatus Zixiibacteriota bacterium]
MPLSHADVRHIAGLARLKLSEAEVTRFAGDLTVILDYINQLSRVDTSSVPAKEGENLDVSHGRPDSAKPSLSRGEALKNAPDTDGIYIRVPKVIG